MLYCKVSLKKTLGFLSIALLSGCGVNPLYEYNNLQGPHKAMAISVNTYGQRMGGAGWASGRTLKEARSKAINSCRQYNAYGTCVIERENQNYVLQTSLNKLKLAQQNQQKQQMAKYISGKRQLCQSYGFTGEDATARCVQQEINNDIATLRQQQAYANTQARATAQARANGLSNYGRCLSTAGETFSSCSNAWNGYTPKAVYKCQYDAFGNQITSTCRQQ